MSRFVLLAALLIPLAACAAHDDGPLAPAREGKLLCLSPDASAKTCKVIASYRWGLTGGLNLQSEVFMKHWGAGLTLTSRIDKPVDQTPTGVCSVITADNIAGVRFFVEGHSVTDKFDSELRAHSPGLQALIGRKVCTNFTSDGSGDRADQTIDGRPSDSQQVQWISQDDHWRVDR